MQTRTKNLRARFCLPKPCGIVLYSTSSPTAAVWTLKNKKVPGVENVQAELINSGGKAFIQA